MNKYKKYYIYLKKNKILHAALDMDSKVAYIFPFDEDGWLVNYYLWCNSDFIELLQANRFEILKFKDKEIAEISLVKVLASGYLAQHEGIPIISIPKKWTEQKQLIFF